MQRGSQLIVTTDLRLRTKATLLGLGLATALVLPITALAGRNTTSSISLETVNGAGLAATQPALGTTVTFSTSYPSNINNPRIEVLCYQADELVFGAAGGVDDGFQLGGGGSIWLDRGGPADCVANLYYFSWKRNTPTSTQLATTTFSAGG